MNLFYQIQLTPAESGALHAPLNVDLLPLDNRLHVPHIAWYAGHHAQQGHIVGIESTVIRMHYNHIHSTAIIIVIMIQAIHRTEYNQQLTRTHHGLVATWNKQQERDQRLELGHTKTLDVLLCNTMCGGHHGPAADNDAGAEVIVPMELDKLYRAYGHQIPDILALVRNHPARNEHLKVLILGAVEGTALALHGQKLRG